MADKDYPHKRSNSKAAKARRAAVRFLKGKMSAPELYKATKQARSGESSQPDEEPSEEDTEPGSRTSSPSGEE